YGCDPDRSCLGKPLRGAVVPLVLTPVETVVVYEQRTLDRIRHRSRSSVAPARISTLQSPPAGPCLVASSLPVLSVFQVNARLQRSCGRPYFAVRRRRNPSANPVRSCPCGS